MALDDETDTGEPFPTDQGSMMVITLLFEAGLAPLALVLGNLFGQDPFSKFAWEPRALSDGALAALPMVLLLLAGLRWPYGPLARIKEIFDETIAPLLHGRPTSDLVLLALAAGIGEELLFRGVIQGALEHQCGVPLSLFLTAVFFGALHPISLTYIVIAGLLGAYLGAVWIGTGNLLTVMVAHALYDFIALLLLLRRKPSGTAD